MVTPLFPLGRVMATPAALRATSREFIIACIARHQSGDWGVARDEEANGRAIKHGLRILSAYPIDPQKPCRGYGDNTLWVITEADRSVTTALLPDGGRRGRGGRGCRRRSHVSTLYCNPDPAEPVGSGGRRRSMRPCERRASVRPSPYAYQAAPYARGRTPLPARGGPVRAREVRQVLARQVPQLFVWRPRTRARGETRDHLLRHATSLCRIPRACARSDPLRHRK
jgi:hypothetical protein